jgi:hypothetical protein
MNPFTQIREELVNQIIGITHPFLSNAITGFIFLAFFLFIAYFIKILIEDYKWKKKSEKRRENFEKNWVKMFNKESKNKK